MRASVFLGWSLLVACQRTEALSLPDLPEGTRSFLMTRTAPGETDVWTVDWPDEVSSLKLQGEGALTIAAFGCALERLGLEPGEQALRSDAAPLSVLPDGLGTFESRLEDGELRPWVPKDKPSQEVDEVLRRLQLPAENRCVASRARLVGRPVEIAEPRGRPTLVVPLDADRILIGALRATGGGTWGFIIHRDGHYDTIDLSDQEELGAFLADDGQLWMLGRTFDGCGEPDCNEPRLTRGPIEGPRTLVQIVRSIGQPNYVAMDGARGGAPFELFVSTSSVGNGKIRTFSRFDGENWRRLSKLTWDELFIPGVVWLGPGYGIGIGAGQANAQTVRYEGGELFYDSLPGANAGAASIRHFASFGTVVGRDNGEIDRFGMDGWVDLGVSQATVYTRSMAAIGDGLIYATGTQLNFLGYRFGQYFPDLGSCPLEELSQYAAGWMTPFGDGSILAVTVSNFDAPVEPVVLELVAPPKDCGPRGGAGSSE